MWKLDKILGIASLFLISTCLASPLQVTKRTLVPVSILPSEQVVVIGQKPQPVSIKFSLCGPASLGIQYPDLTAVGYTYAELHVYVGIPPGPPPTTAPGQFPFYDGNYCSVATASCCIPFSAIPDFPQDPCGKELVIATHAAVLPLPNSGNQGETLWGQGPCINPPNPKTGKCSPWAMWTTVKIICEDKETPPPPPGPETCETAFGKPSLGSPVAYSTFVDLGLISNRWGWQMEPTCSQLQAGISGVFIAGAGRNVGGTQVGTWTAFLTGTTLKVTINTVNYYMTETHVNAELTSLENPAPGQYTKKHDPLPSVFSDIYTLTISCTTKIFLTIHGSVCIRTEQITKSMLANSAVER